MSWPSESEYKDVVRNDFKRGVLDLRLKEGKPKIANSTEDVISDCGEFAIVFPIDVGAKTFALRCRTEDDRDIYEARYQKVSDYLKKVGLPYFVEFTYVREGILVNDKKLPIIRMEWAEGNTLRQFVEQNLENPHTLKMAAAEFQKMVTTLHAHQISHGDFQDGNIRIECDGDNVKIKLIDYDSLCVPGLYSTSQTTDGLSEYQHPQRMTDGWDANEKIDYFSELVIYLSFLSIAEKPELWNQFKDSTEYGLLFAEEDFENPTESEVFRALETLSPEVKQLTSVLKDFCAKTSVDQLASLESLLQSESTYYDSGLGHMNRGEYEEAIADFKSALTHSPNYKETYYQLGCAYFEKGEYAKAINSLSEARAIDPTFTSAYYKLADTYLEIGEYAEMENSLEGARFIAPEEKIPYKTACYKLADAYLEANQPDEAVRVLQKVIEVESMDKTAHHKLADVYLEMNKFDNAASSLEEVIATDPHDLAVHRKLADTYMKQNHYDEAAAILKKIVEEINPDDKIDYYELAYAYRGKCDYDKAVTVLKKVVNEIDGSDKTVHEKLADTYNEAGKYTEAVRSYQQAIAIDNTDKTTHEKLGDAYLGMYNSVAGAFDWAKERAIDSYREVIELDSADKGVGNKLAALQNEEEQNVIKSDSEGDAPDEPEEVASERKDSTASDSDTLKKRQKAEKLSEKPVHPEKMVLIPAGDFSMGGDYYDYPGGKRRPTGHVDVHVDAFYIDKFKVTNAEYKAFVDANPEWQKSGVEAQFHDGNYLRDWDKNNNYPRGEGSSSVKYVSWYAAMAYAKWTGKRLPTEAEWEKSARKVQRDRTGTSFSWHWRFNEPFNNEPFHMEGGVCEWCLDEFQRDFYSKSPSQNPIAGGENIVAIINGFFKIKKCRVARGGDNFARGLPWWVPSVGVMSRYAYRPNLTSRTVGFRCVYVPPAHSDAVGK